MLIDSEALYYVPPYVSLDQVKSGVVKIEKQGYVKLTPDTLKLLSIFINPTTPVSAYKKLKALKLKKLKLSQNSFTELLLLFLKKNLLSRYPIKMGRGSWGAVPKIHVWKDQYTYFRLWHPMGLSLDDQVDIGRYCCIGDGVEFFLPSAGFDHDPENVSIYPLYNLYGKIDKTKGRLIPDSATFRNVGSPKKITVKNDVWIATESLIFPGSTIGNGAVISPRSVVSGHVPDYAIVGGNPARVLRYRFDELAIKGLLQLKWWDWPEKLIEEHLSTFYLPIHEFIAVHWLREFGSPWIEKKS